MNRLPLEMLYPPLLTDEGAAQCLDFLYQLTVAFEQHYAAQLRRYYEPHHPVHPDLFDELEDEPLPF